MPDFEEEPPFFSPVHRAAVLQAERNVLPVLNNLLENREMQLVNPHLLRKVLNVSDE